MLVLFPQNLNKLRTGFKKIITIHKLLPTSYATTSENYDWTIFPIGLDERWFEDENEYYYPHI